MMAAGAEPAAAVAMVDVQNAGWLIQFGFYTEEPGRVPSYGVDPEPVPDGLTFSCVGDAIQYGNSCSYAISLQASTTSPIPQTYGVSAYGGIEISNSTANAFPGYFVLWTSYSAFNPGGSPVGVSVTDPKAEYASFWSSVDGTTTGGVGFGADSHGCSVGVFLGNPVDLYSCGVDSPDSSGDVFVLGSLDPEGTVGAYYSVGISAELKGVPEPLTLTIVASGLVLIGMSRRKQRTKA
jgi:hypothetical protein